MKVLLVEDEYTTRLTVQVVLEGWGYTVDSAEDGAVGWELVQRNDGPQIAILDWEMPGFDGLELCRKIKALRRRTPVYVILLTAKDAQQDILKGFAAGADDYMTKPFDDNELRARVRVAAKLVSTQEELAVSNDELRDALNHVALLQGDFSFCTQCHKVENNEGVWKTLAECQSDQDDPRFNYMVCPDCAKETR